VASICDSSFDDHLTRIALDAAGLKRKFYLAVKPDPTTLAPIVKYRCDTPADQMGTCETVDTACDALPPETQGITCTPPQSDTDGWSYEESTNSLFFNGASVPGLRSVVVISYQSASGT
jgi:hypothetical protein